MKLRILAQISGLSALMIVSQWAIADLPSTVKCANLRLDYKIQHTNVGTAFFNYYNSISAHTRYNQSVQQIEQAFRTTACANKPTAFRHAQLYGCGITSTGVAPVVNVNTHRKVTHTGCVIRELERVPESMF